MHELKLLAESPQYAGVARAGQQLLRCGGSQDVALYGGLCALASFDRSEIKRNVVESIGFREMLELNPEVGSQPSLACD